tara:strand:+ start:270 stop:722 length:453 start_codon:yes stop_codon:yes gene_type:complete
MKKSAFNRILLVVMVLTGFIGHAQTKDEEAVQHTVLEYFKALNEGNVQRIVSVFTNEGAVLPTGAPTAIGAEGLTGNYQYVFDNFGFDLKVTIADVMVNEDLAMVQSSSKGTLVIKANDEQVTEAFRELFVLNKINGTWKIDKYMYNQSK